MSSRAPQLDHPRSTPPGSLGQLRRQLLAAMGLPAALGVVLAGCAPGGVTLDDDDEESPWRSDDTGEVQQSRQCPAAPGLEAVIAEHGEPRGELELCLPTGAEGECPHLDDAPLTKVLQDNSPPPEESYCSWYADGRCGPEPSIVDECCYVIEVYMDCAVEGRPLTVDGEQRVAPTSGDPAWTGACEVDPGVLAGVPEAVRQRAAQGWTRAALAEHASVASFATFALQLLAVGAPPELVARATAAMADEIGHARDAFAVAAALGGEILGPGALPVAGVLPRQPGLREVLLDTLRDGCLNESVAATEAALAAARCADPAIRAVLERVAAEEAAHAALAWAFLRWALEQEPALAAEVDAWIDGLVLPELPQADPEAVALGCLGRLDDRSRVHAWRRTLDGVARPCWRALRDALAGPRRPCAEAGAPAH